MEKVEESLKWVKLNVGGRQFLTTRQTLVDRSDYFRAALNGSFSLDRDENGALLIDRDGDQFAVLLHFCRTAKLSIPAHIKASDIKEEAEYFGIPLPSESSPFSGQSSPSSCLVILIPFATARGDGADFFINTFLKVYCDDSMKKDMIGTLAQYLKRLFAQSVTINNNEIHAEKNHGGKERQLFGTATDGNIANLIVYVSSLGYNLGNYVIQHHDKSRNRLTIMATFDLRNDSKK